MKGFTVIKMRSRELTMHRCVFSAQSDAQPWLPVACTGRAKPVVTASRVHFSYNATVTSPATRIAAILLSTRFPSGACAPLLLGYLFPRTRRTRLTSFCRKTRFMELKARDFATIEALNEAASTAESSGTTQEVVEHRCVCRMGVDRRGGGGKTRGERSQAQPRRRRAHKGDESFYMQVEDGCVELRDRRRKAIQEVKKKERVKLLPGMSIKFHDAGELRVMRNVSAHA